MTLETFIAVVKIVWPIALWVASVNHKVKQAEKDLDRLYFEKRGFGMRDRSIRGRLKRFSHSMKKDKNHGKPTR